jgi:hypothetical protein
VVGGGENIDIEIRISNNNKIKDTFLLTAHGSVFTVTVVQFAEA